MGTVSFRNTEALETGGEGLSSVWMDLMPLVHLRGSNGKFCVFLKIFSFSRVCVCMCVLHVCGHTCAGSGAYVCTRVHMCACVEARGRCGKSSLIALFIHRDSIAQSRSLQQICLADLIWRSPSLTSELSLQVRPTQRLHGLWGSQPQSLDLYSKLFSC